MNSNVVTITIDRGLTQVHSSLRAVCAQGVYQRGLKAVALSINRDPGNLSRELADNGRHLSVDSLERYIERTGDVRPVHYLIERYLLTAKREAEDAHKVQVLQQVQALMASIGK